MYCRGGAEYSQKIEIKSIIDCICPPFIRIPGLRWRCIGNETCKWAVHESTCSERTIICAASNRYKESENRNRNNQRVHNVGPVVNMNLSRRPYHRFGKAKPGASHVIAVDLDAQPAAL